MTTRTTFHLSISRPALALARARAWLAARDPLILIAATLLPLVALLLAGAVWRAQRPAQTPAALETLAPIMIIATARAEAYPTAVPPTPDPAVAAELAALRARVAELEAREARDAAPQPQVVYVSAPAPAPAEPQYTTASEPQPSGIVISDAEREIALVDHQAQQAASCAAGRIANADYCAQVAQWIAEH